MPRRKRDEGYSNQWGNEPWGALPGGSSNVHRDRMERRRREDAENDAAYDKKLARDKAEAAMAAQRNPANLDTLPLSRRQRKLTENAAAPNLEHLKKENAIPADATPIFKRGPGDAPRLGSQSRREPASEYADFQRRVFESAEEGARLDKLAAAKTYTSVVDPNRQVAVTLSSTRIQNLSPKGQEEVAKAIKGAVGESDPFRAFQAVERAVKMAEADDIMYRRKEGSEVKAAPRPQDRPSPFRKEGSPAERNLRAQDLKRDRARTKGAFKESDRKRVPAGNPKGGQYTR